ncbi:MAG: PfkB family carbohydrate kinase [Phenylobacterium sp.]|uniref:carbohydrate kinase family protein n=1 Tax=Phenylobacterium sp. TaxID=1871053 RepID=UPI002A3600C6|nr:PfkB family carbohydrate kinase [Phenylobacterium sp.]MDX9998114.1 PfkB family carbohydrate kinase [Phenylobacterium sp.]
MALRLLVIGTVALDRPVRLSGPLTPGARLAGVSLDNALQGRLGGGGAAAAAALHIAGCEVTLASIVAGDADGERALQLAAGIGADLRLVVRRPGSSRTTLILIDPAGERTIIGLDLQPASLPTSLPPPDERFDGVLVRSPYPGAAGWAAAARGPVVVHWPAPAYDGPADIVVASEDDLSPEVLAAPHAAAAARFGDRLAWVVVTRGAEGATAFGPGDQVCLCAPPARVVDTTGAGDVFAAALLAALAAGADIGRALALGCAWGAATVALDSSAPTDAVAGTFRLDLNAI